MSVLHELVRRIEHAEALDPVSKPLTTLVGRAVQPRAVRNLLSGTTLGHPAHPMATDVPIGAWSMATLLDLAGGRDTHRAADLLVATGMAGAVPAAAAGANDWADTYGPETRVGLVHAAANTTALGLYAASLTARLRSHRRAGKLLGIAGFAVLTAGGYLGGYLSFALGVNVNHTAWEHGPDDWTAVAAETELPDGHTRHIDADGTSILLHRDGATIHAISSICSHAGGPLEEGTITDECVTCPWHGSIFHLDDGHVARGPASAPQPAYDTRITGDQIEIRARD
jgi:nitrite reductase/ring-hydroxylating ferredoxin subunit/uncharacterized membrane protein